MCMCACVCVCMHVCVCVCVFIECARKREYDFTNVSREDSLTPCTGVDMRGGRRRGGKTIQRVDSAGVLQLPGGCGGSEKDEGSGRAVMSSVVPQRSVQPGCGKVKKMS